MVHQVMDMLLDVLPELGAAVTGFDPQTPGQPAVDVDPSEVRVGLVDHQITVRIQRRGETAQGRGLAHPGLTGQ